MSSSHLLNVMWKSVEILPQVWILSVLIGERSSEYLLPSSSTNRRFRCFWSQTVASSWSIIAHPFHRGCGTADFDGSTVPCIQHQKELQKNRLTKQQLKQVPTHDFQKGDQYDICAINLDK